jgi:TonB family protein
MKTKLIVLLLSVVAATHAAQNRVGFTGTYVLGRAEDLPTQVLDYPVMAIPVSPIEYPIEMRGSGATDFVGATVWLEPDGHVSRAIITHGSDVRLQEPAQNAIAGWRFSQPMKDGQPVAALIRIKINFGDSGMKHVVVLDPEKPNQSAQTTRAFGPRG